MEWEFTQEDLDEAYDRGYRDGEASAYRDAAVEIRAAWSEGYEEGFEYGREV